jgi:hypothetical protein
MSHNNEASFISEKQGKGSEEHCFDQLDQVLRDIDDEDF